MNHMMFGERLLWVMLLATFTLAQAACGGETTISGGDDSSGQAEEPAQPEPPDEPAQPEPPEPPEEPTQPEEPEEPVEPEEPEVPAQPEEPKEPVVEGPVPNDGWIGGACEGATDCSFDGALCLEDAQGYAGGTCSKSCERTCPDRDGNNSVTFCATTAAGGRCLSRCDFELYPGQGCRDGYACKVKSRFGEASTQVATCVSPQDMDTVDVAACLDGLTQQGIPWTSWAYSTQTANGQSCTVNEPVKAGPVINGVTYRYYSQSTGSPMSMGCEMANALHKLSAVLKEYNITDVLHIGTFNCRAIAGSSRLSQHSFGYAIDIYGFVDADGVRYILEDDWEHGTESPGSMKARVMYEIGQRMHTERIFNTVLTPNYNAAHDNHFHVDLKEGASFIGAVAPDYYFGSDEERWAESCAGHEH